jgi:hypothetical protein
LACIPCIGLSSCVIATHFKNAARKRQGLTSATVKTKDANRKDGPRSGPPAVHLLVPPSHAHVRHTSFNLPYSYVTTPYIEFFFGLFFTLSNSRAVSLDEGLRRVSYALLNYRVSSFEGSLRSPDASLMCAFVSNTVSCILSLAVSCLPLIADSFSHRPPEAIPCLCTLLLHCSSSIPVISRRIHAPCFLEQDIAQPGLASQPKNIRIGHAVHSRAPGQKDPRTRRQIHSTKAASKRSKNNRFISKSQLSSQQRSGSPSAFRKPGLAGCHQLEHESPNIARSPRVASILTSFPERQHLLVLPVCNAVSRTPPSPSLSNNTPPLDFLQTCLALGPAQGAVEKEK